MAGSVVPTGSDVKHRPRGVVGTVVTMVTDASGAATATVIGVGFGRLVGVFYDGGLDASAVITLRDSKTGANILAYTTGTEGTPVALRPTMPIQDQAGTVIAAAATAPNTNREALVYGKLTVTVASGGNVETGILKLIVDESYIGDLAQTV